MAKRRALILCFILLFVSSYALAQEDAYLFSNFTAGELTRKLDSRMDFNKFFNGARTLENMIVYPQGGASKRPGFKFIHEAKFSDKKSRLIPFVFSDTQAYILEFGDKYIRFYMDGGIIVEDGPDLISTGGFEGGVTDWIALSGSSHYASGVTYQAGSYSCLLTEVGGTGTGYHPTSCCTDPDDDQDNTTGWTPIDSTITSEAGGVTGQRLKVAATAVNGRVKGDALTLTEGKFYRLKVSAGADVGDNYRVWLYSFAYGGAYYDSGSIAGTGAGNWDTINVVIECPSTQTDWRIILLAVANGDNAYFDNVSLNLQTPTVGSGMWQHVDSGITEFEPYELSWYALEGSSGVTYTYAVLDYVSGTTLVSGVTGADSSGDWTTKRICNFTAPVDCTGVTVEFILSETGGTTCYFDTVVLKHTEYPYEISTSFGEDDLSLIKYTQSADVLYLVHPEFAPQKLMRSGHADWTLQDINFLPGPIDEQGHQLGADLILDQKTISGVSVSGVSAHATSAVFNTADEGRSITCGTGRALISGVTDASNIQITIVNEFSSVTCYQNEWTVEGSPVYKIRCYPETYYKKGSEVYFGPYTGSVRIWRQEDVGKYVLFEDGCVKITDVTDSDGVSCLYAWGEIIDDLDKDRPTGPSAGTYDWTLNNLVWTIENGYPSCAEFFEERLFFAGSTTYPQTIWGSQSGDFENFTPGPDDSEAVTFTIAADQINVIRWLKAIDKLLIGTTGSEWWMAGSGDWEPITPSSVTIRRETTYGSQNINPIVIDNSVLFVQKPGKKIRRYGYNYTEDAYRGQDLSILAEHLTNNYAITELAYQQSPNQILWALRADGDLLGLTYMPEHEIAAWHRHSTEGDFESIAVIPGSIQDELWVIVERFVDDVQYRFVEQLQTDEWEYTWGEKKTTGDATYPMGADCVLLLESDITDGSTTFEDSSSYNHTFTSLAGVEHSSATQYFGSTSVYNSAASNEPLYVPAHTAFNIGTGDFTIDTWISELYGVGDSTDIVAGCGTSAGNDYAWCLTVDNTGKPVFYASVDGNSSTGYKYTLTSDTAIDNQYDWDHVAITRESGTIRMFLNGTQVASESGTTTIHHSTTKGICLFDRHGGGASSSAGYIDEFRFINGTATWTSNFIPPTRMYTDPIYATTTTEIMTDSEAGFYLDCGLTYDDSYDITAISGTSPIVITLEEAHDIVSGDTVYIRGVQGMTELNDADWYVTSVGGVTVAIKQDGTLFETYTQGGAIQKLTNSVTGLEHLAGVSAYILADGNYIGDYEVSSGGTIVFTDYYKMIHAGLNYTAILETVDVPKQFGRAKRLPKIHPRFFRTSYVEFGPDTDHLIAIDFPSGETPYTGEMEKGLNFPKGWGVEQTIMFANDEPLPMAISGIIVDYE